VMKRAYITALCALISLGLWAQKGKTPIMGWSSWNNFRVNINEPLIREQADAMVSSGMVKAGYRYVNIDDGYFGGRDAHGNLFADSIKFPSGMKALADYIHRKGLKAGIYTDAGSNTCGSIWDNDKNGIGVGLYGHIKQDCNQFFNQWGYDFLKVDWCGGEQQKLDEKNEYLRIIREVRSIRKDIVFNLCRWQFPGEWAITEADSWRISGDITATWGSICHIIDLNTDLAKYASPGHYNDMDMLQVGRGMTYDEDKSHFSMWCMMLSPLLAGNDLRTMSKETIEIFTNREMIAIHQDEACIQVERKLKEGSVEVWVKPLGKAAKKEFAVAVLNRGDNPAAYTLSFANLGINGVPKARDVWQHKNVSVINGKLSLDLPKHGIVVLRFKCK
jgi:alpha-galactosidase